MNSLIFESTTPFRLSGTSKSDFSSHLKYSSPDRILERHRTRTYMELLNDRQEKDGSPKNSKCLHSMCFYTICERQGTKKKKRLYVKGRSWQWPLIGLWVLLKFIVKKFMIWINPNLNRRSLSFKYSSPRIYSMLI